MVSSPNASYPSRSSSASIRPTPPTSHRRVRRLGPNRPGRACTLPTVRGCPLVGNGIATTASRSRRREHALGLVGIADAGRGLGAELPLVQGGVQAAAGEEFGVGAGIDEPSPVEDEDLVGGK